MLSAELRRRLLKFRTERDWEQFHTPKTLSIALCVEAAELLEHFQWIADNEVQDKVRNRGADIAHEVADLAILLTYLVDDLGLDLENAVKEKLALNEQKYPIDKSRGIAKKYTDL